MNKKVVIIFILSFLYFFEGTYAQDVIKLRNGKIIDCKITQVDSSMVYYNFSKGNRQLSSYVDFADIQSYQIKGTQHTEAALDSLETTQNKTVIIDSSQYVKPSQRWINMITYSRTYGLHATGWAVQYYGYALNSLSKWSLPMIIGIDWFEINADHILESGYYEASIGYALIGISPFYKLNDVFLLKLGGNIIIGSEILSSRYTCTPDTKSVFGMATEQGIYFVPKSKVGITAGVSVYEKLLTSKVYKNDLGIRLELGIKF